MKPLLAVGLGITVAASLGLSAPATANDRPDAVIVSAAAQDAAARHWTADRMRAARPADDLLRRAGHQVTDVVHRGAAQVLAPRTTSGGLLGGLLGGLFGGSGGSGGGRADRGSVYAGTGTVVRTTGRVFFTLGKRDFACSGSSVRAKNENLVQTAGHCVNAGPGAYATNVVFVPGYKDGKAPYGRWTASRLGTTTQWRTLGDLTYDVGYITVKAKKKSLADTVGAQGIAFNLPRGGSVDVFGYPAESPYDGQRLATCRGRLEQDRRSSGDQGVECNLTGGTSGGPWLASFSSSTGAGVITSVSSFRYITLIGESRELYGPYFGADVQKLYSSMQK
jgi:V8-like Glu-specific endopeptidase